MRIYNLLTYLQSWNSGGIYLETYACPKTGRSKKSNILTDMYINLHAIVTNMKWDLTMRGRRIPRKMKQAYNSGVFYTVNMLAWWSYCSWLIQISSWVAANRLIWKAPFFPLQSRHFRGYISVKAQPIGVYTRQPRWVSSLSQQPDINPPVSLIRR
jgi:hypothetical protein